MTVLSSENQLKAEMLNPRSWFLCPLSGFRSRSAAFLCLPGARHRVLPEAQAGDAERDAAAGGPRPRDDGGRGQQGATAPRPGQQGQRIPGDEDSR